MSNQDKTEKYSIYNILYVALFVIISSLLIWKCRYGYTTLDEAFYPTIADRFIQGDAIFSEEWSNTQLSNLILIPILKCYINREEIWREIFVGYGMMALLFCTNSKPDQIMRKDISYVLAGTFFVISVLAQPYLAVIYFLLLYKKLIHRDKEE